MISFMQRDKAVLFLVFKLFRKWARVKQNRHPLVKCNLNHLVSLLHPVWHCSNHHPARFWFTLLFFFLYQRVILTVNNLRGVYFLLYGIFGKKLNHSAHLWIMHPLLKGLDGRGHFFFVLISFRKRSLYKNIGKFKECKFKM